MLSAQLNSELEVKEHIPYYMPLKEEKCKKCKNIIAEPKELIRIASEKSSNESKEERKTHPHLSKR